MTLGVKWESSGKTGKVGEWANNVFLNYFFVFILGLLETSITAGEMLLVFTV